MAVVGAVSSASSSHPQQATFIGTLRYIGPVDFREGTWAGIELDALDEGGNPQQGKNDGSVEGRRYFWCLPGRGIFVSASRIRLASPSFASNSALVTAAGFKLLSSPVKGRPLHASSSLKDPFMSRVLFPDDPASSTGITSSSTASTDPWLFIREALESVQGKIPQMLVGTPEADAFAQRLSHLLRSIVPVGGGGTNLAQYQYIPPKEEADLAGSAVAKTVIARYRSEVDRLQDQVDLQAKKLSESQKKATESAHALEASEGECQRLWQEISHLRQQPQPQHQGGADLERIRLERDRFKKQCDELRSVIASHESTIGNLTRDLEEHRKPMPPVHEHGSKSHGNTSVVIHEYEQTIRELRHKLLEAEQRRTLHASNVSSELYQQVLQLQQQVTTLQRQLSEKDRQASFAESEMERFAALLQEQRGTIARLETQLGEAHEARLRQLANATNANNTVSNTSTSATNTVRENALLNSRLDRQLKLVEREKKLLEEEVQRLRLVIGDARKVVDEFASTNKQLQSQKSSSSSALFLDCIDSADQDPQLAELMSRAADLRSQLASVDQELGDEPWSVWLGRSLESLRRRFILGSTTAVAASNTATE